MIPNLWYPVLESKEVPSGKPIGVTRFGQKLVFWRDHEGNIVCMMDQCRHRGAALSIGSIHHGNLQCPFHGFEYDSSGKVTYIPAKGKTAPLSGNFQVKSYPSKEAHDFIWVWYGEPRSDYPPVPWFEDLDKRFSYGRDTDLWPVHYSRAIENQLDVFHLPYVHHNTIGRGGQIVTDGPYSDLKDNTLKVWVLNRPENGIPARSEQDLSRPSSPALLHFIFPNLWMNRLSDDFRIFIAFVPVDETHTKFYLRYYQSFIRVPLVRGIVNRLTAISSRVILRQDRQVVITQQPVRSDFGMPERLIHADRPIIKYRRHREVLKNNNSAT